MMELQRQKERQFQCIDEKENDLKVIRDDYKPYG